jgi:Ca2+-binding EF-hand superfamily protein
MTPAELHETLRCFSLDVPPEQCEDIIKDFMQNHKDAASGGLDHAGFVRFVLEIDNPDEFAHIGAASMLSRGLRLTHNDDERHATRVEELKAAKERKNADAAGDIAVLVRACRRMTSGMESMEKALRLKDVGRSGAVNLRHFIDVVTDVFGGEVSVTNARRLAGIFDENMVGYVSYERLLEMIKHQVALPNRCSTPPPIAPAAGLRAARVEDIKSTHAEALRMRALSETIRQKVCSKLQNSASEFRKAFEMLDRDGSGYIAQEELSHVLARVLGLAVPNNLAEKLFHLIDRNHNGELGGGGARF